MKAIAIAIPRGQYMEMDVFGLQIGIHSSHAGEVTAECVQITSIYPTVLTLQPHSQCQPRQHALVQPIGRITRTTIGHAFASGRGACTTSECAPLQTRRATKTPNSKPQ